MNYQLKSYIKFLLNSTNQHGVHSPFVFELVTKCFYKKTDLGIKNAIASYRNDLVSNMEFITVTDYGKGSKIFKSNIRSISKIAKVAGISRKRSNLLARVVIYLQLNNILEIGTSLGIGTASMANANGHAQITTIEGCENTARIALSHFKKHGLRNIKIKVGEFSKTLPESIKNNTFDLIYVDGNHQKSPTLEYFEQCLNHVHNETVFIFDDIHWSKEMEDAWNKIKEHPKVTVTIDTFYWGFVFLRKEQIKEHFQIRI